MESQKKDKIDTLNWLIEDPNKPTKEPTGSSKITDPQLKSSTHSNNSVQQMI
jgi:hypothetical protein